MLGMYLFTYLLHLGILYLECVNEIKIYYCGCTADAETKIDQDLEILRIRPIELKLVSSWTSLES